jgi:putative FmdB family regulatory protein
MPLYEYHCDDCDKTFERIQKFSDPLVSACPTCGGPVRKLFSSPAIQFKGSGFYINDYAKSDKPSGKPAASGGSDAKDGGHSDKAEKSDSGGKSDKAEKSGQSEKSEKSDKSDSSSPSSGAASSGSPKPDSPKPSGDPSKRSG